MSKKVAEENLPKKLKVQIGVVKRLQKEVASYEKEVITNEAKIQRMKDEGRDIYDIRKQEEVLQESYMMVPDSKARLEQAKEELDILLERYQEEEGGSDGALISEAKALLV
eukprot:gene9577-10584_t